MHDRNRPGAGGSCGPVNKKRQAKDSKFGFGGSKRLSKQNDAYSSASMEGYKGPGKAGGGKSGKVGCRGMCGRLGGYCYSLPSPPDFGSPLDAFEIKGVCFNTLYIHISSPPLREDLSRRKAG